MTEMILKDGRKAGRHAYVWPAGPQGRRVLKLKTLARVAGGVCVVAVAVLSLLPAEKMARTGLGGHIEHMAVYLGTALTTALAFDERGDLAIFLALSAYAGVLELLQHFSPGRISSIEDFTFSAAGVLMGVVVALILKKALRRSGIAIG
jgi:VanZ family protein